MQEILLKISILKENYQKALKKLIPFFLMGKVILNKRGLELVTSCSSGHKVSSEKFLY